jgi:exo-beta-1,3-glucanase (GH17 family)
MKLSSSLLASVFLLALSSPETTVNALNVRLYGVNYNSRKGPDWAPDYERCKSADEIQQDMYSIKKVSDRVRIYSLLDCNQAKDVLPAAKKAGLQVALGIWTTADYGHLLNEKYQLEWLLDNDLIDENVIGIHVGSEAIYREDITADTAIEYMNEIRSFLHERQVYIPVTIADVIDCYYANPQLIDAVDVVSINQFSFWERVDVNEGVAVMIWRLRELIKIAASKGKEVIISETGWSSSGVHSNHSIATPSNQAQFFKEFYQMAQSRHLKYYWFVAFDSHWRLDMGHEEAEANFGIFHENGLMKDNFQSLFIPSRQPVHIQQQEFGLFLTEQNNNLVMTQVGEDDINGHQVWFYDQSTQMIRSMSTETCLDAYQPENGGIIHIYKCMEWENNQKWNYNPQTKRLEHAYHQGFCMDMDPNRGNIIHLWTCMDGNVNQVWSFEDASSIQTYTKYE